MLNILSNFLLLITTSVHAQTLTCTSGKISQVYLGETKQELAEYCFNNDKTVLISKNCQQKKCKAFEKKIKFQIENLISPMGKPSFRLCRLLGGQPQIIEFFVEEQPYKLDRCLFEDGSYSDSDFLLAYYLKK